MPVVGAALGQATDSTRPRLMIIAGRLALLGHIAIAGLVLSGTAMIWSQGVAGQPIWFWLKMALVGLLVAFIALASRNQRALMAGDAAAMRRAPKIGAAILAV